MLSEAFEGLPESGHRQIITIPGIGPGTAAVLVAKMVSIERFSAPEKIVGYFGIFPEERSSGVDRKGRHIPPGTMVMSHKGCDLVRRYLWNAAKSAIVHNPPVRELYKRLCDRGIRGDIALGHCMQKLLHQVFAVWSTDRPFDPDYRSKRAQQTMSVAAGKEVHSKMKLADSDSGNVIDCISTKTETTAGHNPNLSPDQSVVTTVASQLEPVGNSCTIQTPNVTPGTHQCTIDFSFVREQVNFDQVLNHLGIRDQFKGRTQLRGPCPLCQKNSSRTLSVNLQKNAYKCFNPNCSQGNCKAVGSRNPSLI